MRLATPIILGAAGAAWLAMREPNPARWPGYLRTQAEELIRDVQEAVVDGGRAGIRAENVFDEEVAAARSRARTW
ncbi:MAG: hypothetical protein NWS72_01445 [Thermoleophilia bacterium]|jgi:hypothetical protein|nr:hypothetical protein [Thermoleophilia bacterium]